MARRRQRLSIIEIEDELKRIISEGIDDKFITQFVSLYDIPTTSVNRAQKKFENDEPFVINKRVHYESVEGDVVAAIDGIEQSIKDTPEFKKNRKPRYIIAKNEHEIAAIDTKTLDTLNVPIQELPMHADFFLAWNGVEKADYQAESPADRKAAERFARLYDVIAKDNPDADESAFNLFLIRVLFLLFAEDTGLTSKSAFTNVLKTRTAQDGSDLNAVIAELFEVLDLDEAHRSGKAEWLCEFPYVDGKLFAEPHGDLKFTKESRQLLIEAGELLDWNQINPDILGAMIQSVASTESRHVTGMHYTSVPNIMKVIKPLFLDELTQEFEDIQHRAEENEQKDITEETRKRNRRRIVKELDAFHDRISNIKFFDPACGSGNFLIITYKEIRRLEIQILQLRDQLADDDSLPLSSIHLRNFIGIEIDDFAHEVARLSLWIAQHQMNREMGEALPGHNEQLLPLKDAGHIVCANALRVDWNEIVPHTETDEIYLMGNPPYVGSEGRSDEQRKDMDVVFGNSDIKYKKLDYIAAWFYLAARFINGSRNAYAFVSTNSINQGEQVALLWPTILEQNEISFAYPSFKWANNAKGNAGVTVVIIGITPKGKTKSKLLFDSIGVKKVANISPYLSEGSDIVVENRSKSISGFPEMAKGSSPTDYGGLIFSEEQYETAVSDFPELKKYLLRYMGSTEYINGSIRYILWLDEREAREVADIPLIKQRFEHIKKKRMTSRGAKRKAETPWEFITSQKRRDALQVDPHLRQILIPRLSSENRSVIPMGYVSDDTVISEQGMVVYHAPMWVLALLQSHMHMVWARAVGGRLRTDIRYSALIYNTFPVKTLSAPRKKEMERVMREILDLREYEGGTIADLYGDRMPESLRAKHAELDGIVERAYQQRPFQSDEERLATLLELYEEMTAND